MFILDILKNVILRDNNINMREYDFFFFLKDVILQISNQKNEDCLEWLRIICTFMLLKEVMFNYEVQ